MRNIIHENLVRFIGVCMDDQNVAVITELMIRGSLRDILDEGKMDIGISVIQSSVIVSRECCFCIILTFNIMVISNQPIVLLMVGLW